MVGGGGPRTGQPAGSIAALHAGVNRGHPCCMHSRPFQRASSPRPLAHRTAAPRFPAPAPRAAPPRTRLPPVLLRPVVAAPGAHLAAAGRVGGGRGPCARPPRDAEPHDLGGGRAGGCEGVVLGGAGPTAAAGAQAPRGRALERGGVHAWGGRGAGTRGPEDVVPVDCLRACLLTTCGPPIGLAGRGWVGRRIRLPAPGSNNGSAEVPAPSPLPPHAYPYLSVYIYPGPPPAPSPSHSTTLQTPARSA
jgi:hypothetical protein